MKRLHDVAVRMRPRVPRAPDGAPQMPDEVEAVPPEQAPRVNEEAATGFSKLGDGPRMPVRSPFMPSSRDLARQAAAAADAEDGVEEDGEASFADLPDLDDEDRLEADAPSEEPNAEMAQSEPKPQRPISMPRRQIWDLEPDEAEAVASQSVVTDRTYLPDVEAGADEEATETDASETTDRDGSEDMASRALEALEKAEKQLEARGIPASALYEGEGAKTRVLGFHAPDLETDAISAVARKSVADVRFPAGWIVVVEGPGRGAYFAVTNSVSSIGRGLDQSICLNFGDASISRNNHAAIAYDAEQNRFFLGHGNKSNIVRRNGQPVLSTEELMNGDEIRIGKTTLRFVALCGPDFTWGSEPEEEGPDG